jgi:hypothetical protein
MEEEIIDPVVEKLRKIRLVKVETVLSKIDLDKAQFTNPVLIPTFIRSYIWPRLTFEIDGKQIKVALTNYNKKRTRQNAYDFDPIELAIWKIVAGKKETEKVAYKNRYAIFIHLVRKVKNKVSHKIYIASQKKSYIRRFSGKLHREDRQTAIEKIRVTFKQVINILREQDIRQVWKEEKDLKIVAEVMES